MKPVWVAFPSVWNIILALSVQSAGKAMFKEPKNIKETSTLILELNFQDTVNTTIMNPSNPLLGSRCSLH